MAALGHPADNTLHDLGWGDWDACNTTDEYVGLYELRGSAPPSDIVRGARGAVGERGRVDVPLLAVPDRR